MSNNETSNFAFFDLAGLVPGRSFAGFAAGDFVDMYGKPVSLKAEDMKAFVANTLELIARYKAKGMPGLPIDARKHDKGDSAGWITGASEGSVYDSDGEPVPAVNIVADWTEVGVDLISKRIMTNFSPTVDLNKKIIRGGSLTNWPATIDKHGVPLLAAVELAQGVATHRKIEGVEHMSDDTGVETPQVAPAVTPPVEMAAPKVRPQAQPVNQPETAELLEELFKKVPNVGQAQPEVLAELVQNLSSQMAERQVRRLLEEQQQQWEITELAARLTGGGLRGLPVTIPELTHFFLSLDPVQFEEAKTIFGKITSHGLIEFAELGHGRRLRKQQLPDDYVPHLRAALSAGNTIKSFFDAAGLGDPNQYDLSEFQGGK